MDRILVPAFDQEAWASYPVSSPNEVPTTVELEATRQGVRMVLSFQAMHDEHWTNMAVMGWESELGKLVKLLEA